MTATLTDNEKYLLRRIELLEKQLDRLEWRLLKLELHSIEAPTSDISDDEAEDLAEGDNWLNGLIDYVNNYKEATDYFESVSEEEEDSQPDKSGTNR